MRLDQLVGALGYRVYASDILPYEATDPKTGETKRTDYIVDERARCVWMSRAALDALRAQTSEAK